MDLKRSLPWIAGLLIGISVLIVVAVSDLHNDRGVGYASITLYGDGVFAISTVDKPGEIIRIGSTIKMVKANSSGTEVMLYLYNKEGELDKYQLKVKPGDQIWAWYSEGYDGVPFVEKSDAVSSYYSSKGLVVVTIQERKLKGNVTFSPRWRIR